MFYLQLMHLTGPDYSSPSLYIFWVPIPPKLLLNTSFQVVLMSASCMLELGELCLLTLFVYQKRSAINRNDWFCWGLFLDIKNALSSPGWLSFQQPVQTEPNPQQRI